MHTSILLSVSLSALFAKGVPIAGPNVARLLANPGTNAAIRSDNSPAIQKLYERGDVIVDTGDLEAVFVYPSPATSAQPNPTVPQQSSASATIATSEAASAQPTPLVQPQPYVTSTSASSEAASSQPSAVSHFSHNRPLVMSYYPDWVGSTFPPEDTDFSRFDWIDFAFAVPKEDHKLSWDDPQGSPDLLKRLVSSAHAAGKKAKISIGGWTGSRFFSSAVANDRNRKKFVSNILALVREYNVDGIDIDWEYPGRPGADGNQVNPSDSRNFLAFLRLLRSQLPSDRVITAATATTPFVDSSGNAMADVSQFAAVLDWILLMNYDTWGASSEPGPNAPLYDGCHNSTQPQGNAVAAVQFWTDAGFPAKKLVLGLPSYGYLSDSNATHLRTRDDDGDDDDQDDTSNSNDNGNIRLSSQDGPQIQFRDLIDQGALSLDDSGQFVGSGGFTRYWDECSATPFLHSPSVAQVVTYDDPASLAMKAKFARSAGLLGVNMFDVHGDTDARDLIDAVKAAMA